MSQNSEPSDAALPSQWTQVRGRDAIIDAVLLRNLQLRLAHESLSEVTSELIQALSLCEKLLDSVAFVAAEGDTDIPLRLAHAALARARGAR